MVDLLPSSREVGCRGAPNGRPRTPGVLRGFSKIPLRGGGGSHGGGSHGGGKGTGGGDRGGGVQGSGAENAEEICFKGSPF